MAFSSVRSINFSEKRFFAVLDMSLSRSYTLLLTDKFLYLIFAVLLTSSTFVALPVPEILGVP